VEIIRVQEEEIAKKTDKFIFEAIKPGGFEESVIPIPNLKDVLAWRTWANLMRPEQPTYAAVKDNQVVGVVIGEPIESWFDEGESEIQDILVQPDYLSESLVHELFKKVFEFYKLNGAKQVHVWCLKSEYDSNSINLKCKVAIEIFGFKYKGKNRISKWSGKEIVKLEYEF
jgi:hypothetical protein